MLGIFKKELRAYFYSPTGYVFMGFFLLLSGFFFIMTNVYPASPDYNIVLGRITFIFLIVVPILTMRLISDEKRHKTDQLLLSSPLSLTQMVLGKYFAAIGIFTLTLLITALYPIMLSLFGSIAVWEILGGYLGFFLMGSAFISVGLFASSLTDNQVIAAVTTFGALLLMWLMDMIQQMIPADKVSGMVFAGILVLGVSIFVFFTTRNIFISIGIGLIGMATGVAVYSTNPFLFDGLIIRVLSWFSLLERYSDFAKGILSFGPVIYYISFSFLFVFLTIRVIEKRRWS